MAISKKLHIFDPLTIGDLYLPNRIVMAPLTRSRASKDDVPGPYSNIYYAQRASAGLIISEATQISPQGKGYAFTPGIYSDEQVAGWKKSTDAIHEKDGRIFAQLWHVGRISHPDLQIDNQLPVAPSAIKPEGEAFTESGFKPLVTPRALQLAEIPNIIEQYTHAALCAKRANFDGIEIHAANGYLLDQFIRDQTNKREDAYGGSLENRCRLVLEVIEAVIKIWPSKRVGIRFSPVSPANDIADSNPMATFSYLVEQINRFELAYIHFVEGVTTGPRDIPKDFSFATLRKLYKGFYMANNGYSLDLAEHALEENLADLIAFGRLYIANPDLVERFEVGAPLLSAPKATWYGGGAEGYINWPTLN
ncbi:alkene reductase [Legionella sp. D16C41]|uniref:alkene reductase n=1 Tax=Legionella sp. D16C41 TaxID=3402688 RepID=UPI003AF8C972